MKVTAIVITENEESNINDCLESVKWADEIIVVDSNSTDKTCEIARTFTDKVLNSENRNVTAKRKFSIEKSSNDWILFVDADERITKDLQNEILALESNDPISAYSINRENYYLGRKITHCKMSPDYHFRLFNRNSAAVNDRIVHEAVVPGGETRVLKSSMIHLNVPDLETLLKKMNYYSTHEAAEHFETGKKISGLAVFPKSISTFLRVYISRKGYKEGIQGFYVAIAEAFTNLFTNLKLLKLRNRI